MSIKVSTFFISVLIANLVNADFFSEDSNHFAIISTSPSPPLLEKIDSRLNAVEKMLTERKNASVSNNLEEKLLDIERTIKNLEEKISDKFDTSTQTQNTLPRNCKEVQQTGTNISGIYLIQPELSSKAFMGVCDMETKGGGWTVFLNRFDGSQDFYLDWDNYKKGFGNLAGEFWLGLEHLHQLTGKEVNELLVELVDWNSTTVYARYSLFSIGSEEEGYSLKVLGGYSGNAGDSFTFQGGSKFSTKDRDQDTDSGQCATYHTGAWWYKNCMYSHLTGKYMKATVASTYKYKIMYWNEFRGSTYSLKQARMMVRPKDGTSPGLHLGHK